VRPFLSIESSPSLPAQRGSPWNGITYERPQVIDPGRLYCGGHEGAPQTPRDESTRRHHDSRSNRLRPADHIDADFEVSIVNVIVDGHETLPIDYPGLEDREGLAAVFGFRDGDRFGDFEQGVKQVE